MLNKELHKKEDRRKPVNRRLIYASILVVVIAFIGYRYAYYLYSPGDLSKAHKEITECSKCHRAFGGVANRLCENCHSERDMMAKSSSGVVDIHRKVEGKGCADCHPEHLGTGGIIVKKVDHKGLTGDVCLGCHSLPEDRLHRDIFLGKGLPIQGGLFSTQKAFAVERSPMPSRLHNRGFGFDCLACHTTEAWKPARFDHKELKGFTCFECHNFPDDKLHSVTYTKIGKNDCAGCHNTDKWKPARLDHKGISGKVCLECHDLPEDRMHKGIFKEVGLNEKPSIALSRYLRFFSPSELIAAEKRPLKVGKDEGLDCLFCHTVESWKPAKIDMERHTFPVDHRGARSCKDCHPVTVKEYTCYECHEHNVAKVERKHLKEGIREYANCMECHPTGLEHEGRWEKGEKRWKAWDEGGKDRYRGYRDDEHRYRRYERDDDD